MKSILISEILLYIFVLVDDWYQEHANPFDKASQDKSPNFEIVK